MFALASSANAQSGSSATSTGSLTRATTTFFGDTGLWFVPTAEVLAHGKWSGTGYRRGTNYIQGFTNVGDFAGTAAFGVRDRAELFVSFLFDTRIDRDLRPIFIGDPKVGGVVDRDPGVDRGWTGDNVGDLYVGGKVNLWSQGRGNPLALAVRGIVKAPTGDVDAGVSSGKADLLGDFILSRSLTRFAELGAYAGYEWRGRPDIAVDAPTGAFRWGVGTAVSLLSPLVANLEVNGLVPNADSITLSRPLIGVDRTVSPLVSSTENLTRATAALNWHHRGFFIGGGISWNLPRESRDGFRADSDPFGDYVDWQVRIGYHPGVRGSAALPRTAQGQPAAEPPAQAGPPGAGQPGTAQPPAAAPPAAAPPAAAQPAAPPQPAPAPKPAPDQAARPTDTPPTVPLTSYTFEDVHFEFDRFTLRPDARQVLDKAIAAMRSNAQLRLEIEGHTCSIGTAEYNLALGDRRANAVRDYLVSQGVPTARLSTVSYGEERPAHDNDREETRRLNRRAALVVNVR
jgi:outer membrane protein OmpA-like peptidoglycan-associated protein